MKRSQPTNANDRGAALVTVLTMLAVMSTLAIVVVDAANMSVRRTGNMVRMEQTRWYLMGAEAFAVVQLAELRRRSETARIDQDEWQNRPFVFPLDDGVMEVSISDGGNCFNLNSLVVSDDGGGRFVNAAGMVQFSRLLDAVGVQTAQGGLAAALVDWIDSDSEPMAGGAEDSTYAGDAGAYRTGNTLLADVSELARVRGFDANVLQLLAPHICVRPTSAANLINPNTLTPDQAPLLTMAINDLSTAVAAQIIRDRPRGGWESVDDFLRHPSLNNLELNDAGRAQFSTTTRYFVLRAQVERDGAREYSAALIEVGSAGPGAVVRRVFGAGAAEYLL